MKDYGIGPIMGIWYDEYGYQVVGRIPNVEELKEIKQISKKHIAACKAYKDKVREGAKSCLKV